jgi:hypothetical protein
MVQIHDQLAASYPQRTAEGGWEWDLLNDNLYLDEGSLLLGSQSESADGSALTTPYPDSSEVSISGASGVSGVSGSSSATAPSKRKRAGGKGKDSFDDTAEITEKISSLFTPGESVVVTDDLSATIHVDDKPLDESLKLEYKGTFTVYLNEDNKICRYEFVHTTLKELRAREAAAAAAAEAESAAAKAGMKGADDSGSSLSTAQMSSNESSGDFPEECK